MVRAEGETLLGLFFETGGTGNAWYLRVTLPLPLLCGAAPFWCVFLSAVTTSLAYTFHILQRPWLIGFMCVLVQGTAMDFLLLLSR